jgi:phage antirepressor YoqD-like protein
MKLLKEIDRDSCTLVGDWCRARKVGVKHLVEFLRANGREELQRSTES